MIHPSRLPVVLPFLLGCGSPAAPAAGMLPPLDGALAGVLEPLLLPGAPAVKWEVVLNTPAPGRRELRFKAEGAGLAAEGSATVDARGDGAWTLDRAKVDLGVWSGPVAGRFAPAGGGVLGGELAVSAAGTIRDGVADGDVEITLSGGTYDEPARKLSVAGVTLKVRGRIRELRERRTGPGQVLAWERGSYDRFALGAGRVVFRLAEEKLHIEEARVGVLGGELSVERAAVALNASSFAVAAEMRGVQLAELLPLLPPLLASARGRLDGRIALQGDAAGLRLEGGNLNLRAGETAELKFMPTPGVISGQLPAAVRQHYPGLVQLEAGGVPLVAEHLEIVMNAAPDEEGRTAVVSLSGGPADPLLRAPVVLELNIRGPLDEVVAFGTNSRVRFGGGR